MGTQRFDFRHSHTKLVSVRNHLDTLKRETERVLHERCPYTFSMGEIDPETGWCDITMTVRELSDELGLGTILGDFMTNLRSAWS